MRQSFGRRRSVVFMVMAAVAVLGCVLPAGSAAEPRAKNVIIMIADGCGYNHVDAASLYEYGRTGMQVYEGFPVRLGMSTFNHKGGYDPDKTWAKFSHASKSGATDSAAAATAMSSGVKSYNEAIGVNPDKVPVKHAIAYAEECGKSTGVITSVQFSHATPAGFCVHDANRSNYDAIARRMIYESPLEVIMGCGHPEYGNDGKRAAKKDYQYVGGKKAWADLKDGTVMGADADGDGSKDPWTVIQDAADIRALMQGPAPARVIAIAKKRSTLQQKRSGNGKARAFEVPFNGDVPTLAEMATAAINVLDDDPDGFFLMIEGGAVDWASHDNQAGRLIEEQIDFNEAMTRVVQWVTENSSWQQTLLIVTSDHECGYLTGPDSGEKDSGPVWNPIVNNGPGKDPAVEWHSTSHTNSLVPFYCRGAGSDLFDRFADKTDPVRGRYMDNTCIFRGVMAAMGAPRPDPE